MKKIKPIWRIVIGFLLLCSVVTQSNMMTYGGEFWRFAVAVACFVVYVCFAIKIPYDDPLRSMRDLMAQQAQEQAKAPAPDAERLAALEAELAELRQQLRDREE